MGSDNLLVAAPDFVKRFQSTLPGWGATSATACWNKCTRDFNPRSPDGERPGWYPFADLVGISIHAPRMGSDDGRFLPSRSPSDFNPRSPDGERPSRMIFPRLKRISIHAPRMGSDRERRTARTGSTHFNPRSPDGERRSSACSSESSSPYFNPRSPDGERRVTLSRVIGVSNFNPRSPDGERRSRLIWVRSLPYSFQSTLPGWGATIHLDSAITVDNVFQSTLPGWGATAYLSMSMSWT